MVRAVDIEVANHKGRSAEDTDRIDGTVTTEHTDAMESESQARADRSDACTIYCYDEPKVKRVRERLSQHDFQETADLFKVLADETRLKIACALSEEEELCVCDVANIIGSSMATASHHLRLLRNMGIATTRKEGKLVFYSLRDERLLPFIRLAIPASEEVTSRG